jgi:hypothetical protein
MEAFHVHAIWNAQHPMTWDVFGSGDSIQNRLARRDDTVEAIIQQAQQESKASTLSEPGITTVRDPGSAQGTSREQRIEDIGFFVL